MVDASEARASWEQSAAAWTRGIRQGEANRERLLDAPVLAALGEVRGQRVLDVGCGEGRFCRMLKELGARPLGIDPTVGLLEAARQADPEGRYLRADGEAVPLQTGGFDAVLSYLTLIDIPNFRAAIVEMSRVLAPGGRLVIVNINSFASTGPRAWHVNEAGEKLHVAVRDYYDERSMRCEWGGISIVNYHRPFEAYMSALLGEGLRLESFVEPRPTLEAVAEHPTMIDEYRVPLFHVMAWRKERAE